MILTFQDGINDTLFALAAARERCHIDGRIDDSRDRLCTGVKSGILPDHGLSAGWDVGVRNLQLDG
ncbi:hypothetical protein QFZ34_001243 [Phyllobacterium ifriqiyense]|uniref:Uncharacterized protein n=1 Tax=Phyllobacterium ifriqiyense TaxID=314238 RepID=A0ABU0S6B9_9HYPH|nr:hypothetical protein [Phyllobacterium ifriqiyense]MDQ0996066.1 hypothetical protein [Phyllobacterium ifriqiyense]